MSASLPLVSQAAQMLHHFRKSCLTVGTYALVTWKAFVAVEMHSEWLHEEPERPLLPLASPKESDTESAPSNLPSPPTEGLLFLNRGWWIPDVASLGQMKPEVHLEGAGKDGYPTA